MKKILFFICFLPFILRGQVSETVSPNTATMEQIIRASTTKQSTLKDAPVFNIIARGTSTTQKYVYPWGGGTTMEQLYRNFFRVASDGSMYFVVDSAKLAASLGVGKVTGVANSIDSASITKGGIAAFNLSQHAIDSILKLAAINVIDTSLLASDAQILALENKKLNKTDTVGNYLKYYQAPVDTSLLASDAQIAALEAKKLNIAQYVSDTVAFARDGDIQSLQTQINSKDPSSTNELITTFQKNGTNLEIVEAGTTRTVPILSLAPVQSITGISSVSVNTASGTGVTTLSLLNDNATPSAGQYYGTNGSSIKGWYTLPTASTTTNTLTGTSSAIVSSVNGVTATLTPSSGTIAQNIGFDASGNMVKQALTASIDTSALASDAQILALENKKLNISDTTGFYLKYYQAPIDTSLLASDAQIAALEAKKLNIAQYISDTTGNYAKYHTTITNSLTSTGSAFVSNVSGVTSTLSPAAGTTTQVLGFDASGNLVKQLASTIIDTSLLASDAQVLALENKKLNVVDTIGFYAKYYQAPVDTSLLASDAQIAALESKKLNAIDTVGFFAKYYQAPTTITNSLTASGSAFVSNVSGVTSTLTPATGTLAQYIGFDASGNLVKNILSGGGGGITSLNGQTGTTQTFANDALGTAPLFTSSANVHTLSIPLASGTGVTSGTISKTDYTNFTNKWGLTGNAGTTAGTNFVGTTDAQDLVFKTNGQERLRIKQNDQVYFRSGATGTPSITFANNANTGLYSDGTNLNFSINGFERMALSPSGRIINFGTSQNIALNGLNESTSGYQNVAIGGSALIVNTTGAANMAIGFGSLASNTTGNFNSVLGSYSLNANTTGSSNTAIGSNTMQTNVDGFRNTAIGNTSLNNNTSGYQNTSLGYGSAGGNQTGYNNINIGFNAGEYTGVITNLINTIVIGASISNDGTIPNNSITIGNASANSLRFKKGSKFQYNLSTDPTIGQVLAHDGTEFKPMASLYVAASNVGIGTTAPTSMLSVNGSADKIGGGSWGVFSDKRIKKDIVKYKAGLSEVLKINTVKFKYDYTGLNKDLKNTEFVGVIAQDIEKILPSTVQTKEGAGLKDLKTFDASELPFLLINAIQEQQKQIEDLKKQILELQKK